MLKLKDVIWETTLKCNKNCEYCGSKGVLRPQNPSHEHLISIAKEIANYGVEVVTLSGGEPGLLDDLSLFEIIDCLKNGGCSVRVITNGTLFSKPKELLDKFDIIGLSINTPADYHALCYVCRYDAVMVTNFGTHNIWNFDELAEIARKFRSWQIQLTTGNSFMLNPEGIKYLRKKIRYLVGVKYILADNLQDEHVCSAGINSCGITSNGDVIPCLSERAWGTIDKESIQGNIFDNSLKDIWESSFNEIRFSANTWKRSCRNCVKYPAIDNLTPTVAPIGTEVPQRPRSRASKSSHRNGNVYSYGVTDWNVVGLNDYKNESRK
jgi:radical SAM protein with 4Fe4S-binding SPASM domain